MNTAQHARHAEWSTALMRELFLMIRELWVAERWKIDRLRAFMDNRSEPDKPPSAWWDRMAAASGLGGDGGANRLSSAGLTWGVKEDAWRLWRRDDGLEYMSAPAEASGLQAYECAYLVLKQSGELP